MKTHFEICGAILILAGCVIFHDPPTFALYTYAFVLNVLGAVMIVATVFSGVVATLKARATALVKEIKEEIKRQNDV